MVPRPSDRLDRSSDLHGYHSNFLESFLQLNRSILLAKQILGVPRLEHRISLTRRWLLQRRDVTLIVRYKYQKLLHRFSARARACVRVQQLRIRLTWSTCWINLMTKSQQDAAFKRVQNSVGTFRKIDKSKMQEQPFCLKVESEILFRNFTGLTNG